MYLQGYVRKEGDKIKLKIIIQVKGIYLPFKEVEVSSCVFPVLNIMLCIRNGLAYRALKQKKKKKTVVQSVVPVFELRLRSLYILPSWKIF